jgi:hypothetical protein
MTTRKVTTTVALTGALAIASGGAYALGTQADDGSAAAAAGTQSGRTVSGHPPGPPGERGFGLDRLATRLGVDQAKLRTALESLRQDMAPHGPRGERDGQFAKDLAAELGTTQAKVEAALKKVRVKYEKQEQAQRDAFAEKLAAKLGLDASKVKKALEAPKGFRGRPGP